METCNMFVFSESTRRPFVEAGTEINTHDCTVGYDGACHPEASIPFVGDTGRRENQVKQHVKSLEGYIFFSSVINTYESS